MARSEPQRKLPRFVMIAAVCVIVAALYFAREVLIPVTLAVMLSFILGPLVTKMERWHLHRPVAVAILATVVFSALGLLTWVVTAQVDDLAQQLPAFQDNIVNKVRSLRGHAGAHFARAADALEKVSEVASEPTPTTAPDGHASSGAATPAPTTQPIPVRIVSAPGSTLDTLQGYVGDMFGVLGTAGIVFVFVIFMLLGREDLRDRIIRLVGESQIQITTEALDDAGKRISHYLVAQCIVNGTYGICVSTGLCIIGLTLGHGWFPSFVLWGFLCAVFRFIPYIGPWIGGSFPILLSFAVFPGYSVFVAVASMFVGIELFSNMLMEPWLYGSRTGMSTVAVLVAAVFWTWLWGPAGLLLSTPLTVCLVVLGKYVPQMAFLDILLGDEPVLEPYQRLYQRMLAMDVEEATEVAEEYFEEHPLEEVYDKMILPALAMAEQDRHSGRLDEDRGMSIRQNVKELIEELADSERVRAIRQQAGETIDTARDKSEERKSKDKDAEKNGKPQPTARPMLPKGCPINVICLPAHDEADEMVGFMLAQLLELRGYHAINISQNALASEMVQEVKKQQADIVCVSALPPAAVAHARYICKRLYAQITDLKIVICLWTLKQDLNKAKQRVACSADAPLTTSLIESLNQIHRLAEPLCVPNKNGASSEQNRPAQSSPVGV